jgi:hypothetical protein
VSTAVRTAVRERWAALDRPGRVLAYLAGGVLAVRLLVYGGVAAGDVVGDESYYFDAARALSNAVRDLAWVRSPDLAELDRIAVGSGWFMPGMSVVLTPLYLVVPDAPLALVRGYLLLFSTALLAATVLQVRRTFGDLPAGLLLVFPGLVPSYAAFAAAGWGDSAAGLVLVLMLCRAVEIVRAVREDRTVSWRRGIGLGLLAIAAVYCRSSVSIVVVAVLGVTFVTTMLLAAGAQRRRVLLTYVAAGVAFVAVLAPWSVSASAALDSRVLTTVSVPTVRANTFGDRDQLCFGECDRGSSIWFAPLRYSREHGRAAGVSETEIAAEMSVHARRDVTAQSYARDVGINTGRYVGTPASFAALMRWDAAPYDVVPVVWIGAVVLFYPAMLLLLVALGAVARRSFDDALTLVALKAGLLALLVQPFVHIAGPRYWTTLAPLLALALAVLWTARRRRRAGEPVVRGPAVTTLYAVQVTLGVFAGLVVVSLGLLAI